MQINFARREIACKIVYYGPGMSGKTTNLEVLHAKTPRENKGELTCIATEGDRTLFFDFMPLNLGSIRGMNTKFQLYTVPGQVYYNSTRKLVLRGVDGVIFVADSAPDKMEENVESLKNLEENLRDYGRDMSSVAVILQYNKRDRPDAVDVKLMNDRLNPDGKHPWFEAVAPEGKGVFDALKAVAGNVIQNLDLGSGPDAAPLSPMGGTAASPQAAGLAGNPASGSPASSATAPSSGGSAADLATPAAATATSTATATRTAPAAQPAVARPAAQRRTGATAKPSQRRVASTTSTARRPVKAKKAPLAKTKTATRTRTDSTRKPRAATASVQAVKKRKKKGSVLRTALLALAFSVSAAGAAWYFLFL